MNRKPKAEPPAPADSNADDDGDEGASAGSSVATSSLGRKSSNPRPSESPTGDLIQAYLQRVGRVPLLSRDGELELAHRRDRALALVRALALRSTDAAKLDGLDTSDTSDTSEQGEGAAWLALRERCLAWTDLDACSAALDGELAHGFEQTQLLDELALEFEAALSEALALPDATAQDRIEAAERRLAWPRTHWAGLQELIESTRRDARRARAQLIESNLRLVVAVARRFTRSGMPLLDLIQEGNLGLMRAAEKYDPNRGFRFSTYAIWWIRQAVTRSLADHGRTIRLPVHVVERLNKLNRARREHLAAAGSEPSPEQLAERLDISVAQVHHLMTVGAEPASLELSVGEDSELGDLIEDANAPDLVEQIAEFERADHLERLLGALSERERRILSLRFGLDGGDAQTLEVIGREFALTRERVRQIEAQALRKLARPAANKIGK